MLKLLFLILLLVGGAVRSIGIFNDVLYGQVDSAVSDFTRDEVSNATVGDCDFGMSLDTWYFGVSLDETEPCRDVTSSSNSVGISDLS